MVQLMRANIVLHEYLGELAALVEEESERLTAPNEEERAKALTTQEESETPTLLDLDYAEDFVPIDEDDMLADIRETEELANQEFVPPSASLMRIKSAPQLRHSSLDKPALKRSLSNPDLQQRNTAASKLEET